MPDGIEIERKFLVGQLPDLEETRRENMRQGYFTRPEDSAQVRLRQQGEQFVLTVKSGSGSQRTELEAEIDETQFDVLWPATEVCRVEKVRWTGVLECGAVFELDLFEGDLAPLRLVEVEFQSLAEAEDFVPPDWFGRDVTDDVAYTNVALAVHGVPKG